MESLMLLQDYKVEKAFRAKNHFDFQYGKYRLYVADQRLDLYKALQLRTNVFFGNGEPLDIDDFDFIADHILIERIDTKEVIGTYRILSDIFCSHFYSQTEFNIDVFLQQEGRKIELGRACIHPDHRNGRSIDLLWRGIAQYMTYLNAEYLFGCSSIFFKEVGAIQTISHLKAIANANPYKVQAKDPYPVIAKENHESKIPGLLQSYMRAGAQIVGDAQWDQEMQCADFFTYLKKSDISPRYKKHYF